MSAPAHTPSLVVMAERTAAAVAALRFQLTMGAITRSLARLARSPQGAVLADCFPPALFARILFSTVGADTLSTTGTAFVLVLSMCAKGASTAILAGSAGTVVLANATAALLECFAQAAEALGLSVFAVHAAAAGLAKMLDFAVRARLAALLAVGFLPHVDAQAPRRPREATTVCGCACAH
jgi:hypothetical protein